MPTFEEDPRSDDQQPSIDIKGELSSGGRIRKEPDVTPPESDAPGMDPLSDSSTSDGSKQAYTAVYSAGNSDPTRFPDITSFDWAYPIIIRGIREHGAYRAQNKLNYPEITPSSMGGAIGSKPPIAEKKPEKTGPTLDDIGGYEDAKVSVRKFLAAALHPEKFREWGTKPPKGLLLYGPPGTGKTMFAKAIATELSGHFEAISPADINSKWFGESEERIKKLFEDARKRSGHTVIFIDEIESMLPQRNAQSSGGVKDSIMTMFLQYMDGKDSPDNVTIVGATNRIDAIDSAVLRPGRFDRKIEIGYPDPEARAAILGIHIAAKEKVAGRKLFDLDQDSLDTLLRGAGALTGAQIAEVVRRTCEAKAYAALEKDETGLVTVDDLIGSFASLIAESARYDS